jgi:hypothetical protein
MNFVVDELNTFKRAFRDRISDRIYVKGQGYQKKNTQLFTFRDF